MNISRRKFFFFGLAAGVGLFLPDDRIELDDYIGMYFRQEPLTLISGINMGVPYHIPYHQNTSQWLDMPRGRSIKKDVIKMIKDVKQSNKLDARYKF